MCERLQLYVPEALQRAHRGDVAGGTWMVTGSEIGACGLAPERGRSFSFEIHAAGALLSGPEGNPEQADGLLERWVTAWAAASGELPAGSPKSPASALRRSKCPSCEPGASNVLHARDMWWP